MKKFLILLLMLIIMPALADTMPFYSTSIPKTAIGVYQAGDSINIYSAPDANAYLVKDFELSYSPETMPDEVFAILINEKKLGFLYVTDIDEDGWVEVIYNKQTGAKGWVKTEDNFQFLPWLSFYNMYGRKYGIRLLKDAPDDVKCLHAKSEDLSQNLDKINYAKHIKLTTIRGNWALVSVLDLDKTPKIGFLKWRNTDGQIYAFPNIK